MIITTFDEKAVRMMNRIPALIVARQCEVTNTRVAIEHGYITQATQTHRDYVSKYDGRNMYCNAPVNTEKTKTKMLINSIYGK